MTRRAAIRTADIARLVRGAISGGLPAGSFIVEQTVDGRIRLLPTAPGVDLTSPDSGEAEWDKALGLQ